MVGTKPGENEFDKIGSQYKLEKLDIYFLIGNLYEYIRHTSIFISVPDPDP